MYVLVGPQPSAMCVNFVTYCFLTLFFCVWACSPRHFWLEDQRVSYGDGAQGAPRPDCGLGYVVGWHELQGTTLASVCASSIDFPHLSGSCEYVVSSWSGGVADTLRNRLVLWGGGSNYDGNEIYALDLQNQQFVRLTDPSIDADCVETNADNTPNARDTFNGLAYIEHADRLFEVGGSLNCSAGQRLNQTWTFDFATNSWASSDPTVGGPPGGGNLGEGMFAAYDAVSGRVFVHDAAALWAFDQDSNTYSLLHPSVSVPDLVTGVMDPVRRLFVAVGGGHVRAWDVSPASDHAMKNWDATVSGCDALQNADAPGLAYDSHSQKIVGWAGGDVIYLFDVDTQRCSTMSFVGGPGSPATHGTFGRFRYFPACGVFALVNDWQQNAFVLRLPD